MNRQQSFKNEKPSLYLVPTPIGNLSEFTERAVEVLNSVDVIACEDTRTSGQLLKHFNISKRLIAYQNFNETSSAKGIVSLLKDGYNVGLISDAGYPLISDPGQRVVMDVISAGFNVIPVSGANACLNALVASGLPAQPFLFVGFLPSGNREAVNKLKEYKAYPMTMVFYEAPHRIERTMRHFLEVFGDRPCCIAREMTKIHEEFLRGTVSEMIDAVRDIKGEIVIVMGGNHDDDSKAVDLSEIMNMVNESMARGLSRSDAIRETAAKTGVPKNRIYDLVHHKDEKPC